MLADRIRMASGACVCLLLVAGVTGLSAAASPGPSVCSAPNPNLTNRGEPGAGISGRNDRRHRFGANRWNPLHSRPVKSMGPRHDEGDALAALGISVPAAIANAAAPATSSTSLTDTFESLYSFPAPEGIEPNGPLVLGADGNYYGTTGYAGLNGGYGTVFRLTPAGALTTIHAFDSTDGAYPSARLTVGSDGAFYGVTQGGGANNLGTVFRIAVDGTFSLLHSFEGTDGQLPFTPLLQASDGNFYGTCSDSTGSFTVIYRVTPGGALSLVHTLSAAEGYDVSGPLVQGTDGNLYGTTLLGGASGVGSIFRLAADGTFTPLYSFSGLDGDYPAGGLALANDGNFYGITDDGGDFGAGTVYRFTPAGALTTLHSFSYSSAGPDGYYPEGELIQAQDGDLYGTTALGGTSDSGTVFRITLAGTLTTIHSFDVAGGSEPQSGLLQAADGTLLGVALGGDGLFGAVYSVSPGGGGYDLLHSFYMADGAAPGAGLTFGADGDLYGTAELGGRTGGYGTVFRFDPATGVDVLHEFGPTDGTEPQSRLAVGDDGALYGTTPYSNGTKNGGTVFRVTADGGFTSLHTFPGNFCGSGEAYPQGGVTPGPNGLLYGGLVEDGLYSISEDGGQYQSLYTFSGADGQGPRGALVSDGSNAFLGVTAGGGASNTGTVFKFTTDGQLTSLYSFTALDGSGENADGAEPAAGPIIGMDGNLYGTTTAGGELGFGTIYRISADGQLTVLHAFACGNDGGIPLGGLVQGPDGSFYGTASACEADGSINNGTVFQLAPDGTFSTLHVFNIVDGQYPIGSLVIGADGSLYGTTELGGTSGIGTIFRISLLPPAPGQLIAVEGLGQITLSWAPVAGATSYNIYQGGKPGGESAQAVQTGVKETRVVIGGLSANTTYYFQVSAVNKAGESARSNEASAHTFENLGAFGPDALLALALLGLLRRSRAA